MLSPRAFLSPQFMAGFVAIAVGLVDHWAFHDSFTRMWDQALILGGVGYIVGVGVPTPPTH